MRVKNKFFLIALYLQCCLSLSAQHQESKDKKATISPEEFFEKFKERIDQENKQATMVDTNSTASSKKLQLVNKASKSALDLSDKDRLVPEPVYPVDPGEPIEPIDPGPIKPWKPIDPDPDPDLPQVSKVVGEIRANAQVTQIGSSAVGVAFDGYSDPRNYAPQLGLAYNNMAGASPFGFGWSISGTSMISRTNRVLYYDNRTSAPALNQNDAFTLDGKRLIELSRTSSQIKYKTESGQIKVTANYSGTSISSFVVYYTNGDVSTYNLNDGINYYVTSSTDKIGNTITYSYTSCTGHYRLSKVSYGAEGKATIEFSYTSDSSNTAPVIFKNGQQIKYNYYLSSVQTKYAGKTLKNYTFVYTTKENRRMLKKVQCSCSYEEIEPIVFDYTEDNTTKYFTKNESQLMEWLKYEKAEDLRALTAKISYGSDNDGIVMYQAKNPYAEFYQHSSFWRHSKHNMTNQYNGDESILLATQIDQSIALGLKTKTGAGFIDLFTCDLDGFQDDEIVKVNQNVVNDKEELKFTVYRQYLGGIAKKYERTFTGLTGLVSGYLQPKYFYTGDYNGDGKVDIMMITSSEFYDQTVGTKCIIFDLEKNSILYNGSPFSFYNRIPRSGDPSISSEEAFNRSEKVFPMDFDGDGKTDVCIVKEDGSYFYTFNGSSSLSCTQLATTTTLKKSDFTDKTYGMGDFNGDGNIDIIVSPTKNNGSSWKIFASSGRYTFTPYSITLCTRGDDDSFAFQDIDLDGQTDLVDRNKSKIYTHYIQNFVKRSSSSSDIKENTCLVQTDVKEKNKWYSLLSIQNDGKIVKMNLNRDVLKNLTLSKFTNSLGLQTKFQYGWLNDTGQNFYQKGYDANFPYDNFQGRLAVCNRIEAVASGKTVSRVNYSYSNAVVHYQGLGFRGFSSVYAYDDVQGCSTRRDYDPYHFSNLLSEENYKKKMDYTYSYSVASNKLISNKLTKREFTDKTNGVTSTTLYSYDGYGSMTKSDETFSDGSEVIINREYKNVDDNTHNIIGLLTKENRTTITSEGEQANESKEYSYNGNNMVVTEKTKINGNTVLTTSYEYDTNQNVNRKASKYFGSTREETETYVTNNLGQLTSKTDKYGLTSTFSYDSYGRLSTCKDARGLTTKYGYDTWGNLTSTTSPDGITTTTKAKFSLVSGLDAVYYTETTAPNKPTTRSYYNAQGNVVRKEEQHFDGSFVKTDFEFDNRNRVKKQSMPYRSTCTGWKTTEYDTYDRPTTVTYPSGKVEKTSYSGLNVSNTVDGVTTTKTVDCLGNVVKTVSPTGTTLCHYNGLGKLISMEGPGGLETTIEYDQYGRKSALNDPSSGTTTYEYNSEGQLERKTDARGYATVYSYDAYNRPIEKTLEYEDKTATFQYDSYGNMIYQEESDGIAKSFVYDSYNRLVSKKHTGKDGNWLKTDIHYENGNIVSADYTSNYGKLATENYTYAYGNLSEVKLNGEKVIYKVNSENENGLVTKYTTGYLTHEQTFDLDGRTLEIKDSKNDHIYNGYRYTYDLTTGNLVTRQDFGHSFTESFKYDNMNRLIEFGGKKIEYNDLGNITYSSYAGNYTYDSDMPYRLESIDNNNGILSPDTRSIGYNTQMRVTSISERHKSLSIEYDIDENRVYSGLTSPVNSEAYQKYYLGGRYEIVKKGDDVKEIFYLGNDAYSANNVLVRNNRGSWTLYDICRDNLNSIVTIVSENGTVVQDVSYDAWGNMRNPSTGVLTYYELFLDRGYTGHEYLAAFGLYNMNARLYSPKTCRFLGPDPIVSLGLDDQGLNRYSYCLNNPFRYTDPSGKFVITTSVLIAVGVAAVIGGVANIVYQACSGNIHNFWDGLAAFGIGAVAGGVGALAGIAACAAVGITAVGVAGGALAGAVGGGVSAIMNGFGNYVGFNQPMNWSSVGWSIIGGGVLGGIAGGVTALCKGQNIWANKIPKGNPTPQATAPSSDSAGETQATNSVGSGEAQTAAKSAAESTTGIPRDHSLVPVEKEWPPHNGFAGGEPTTTTEHFDGQVFDRVVQYDGDDALAWKKMLGGKFLTDPGTPQYMRCLPYSDARVMNVQFQIPEGQVLNTFDGKAAAWPLFGSPGGANQYMTPLPIFKHIEAGQLRIIGIQIHFDGTTKIVF